jgi:hypothetical protein
MKESYKEKMERLRMSVSNKIDELYKKEEKYKNEKNWEGAMKCDIMSRTLLVVLGEFDEALN